MKKKYFLIGFIVLFVALFGYHLYAASEAERQIDKTIQEQTAALAPISVQYSAIDIAPFSGNISFADLTVIVHDHIQRAQKLSIDVGYIDFLNFYFGGPQYGLENINKALLTLHEPSYLGKKTLSEIKMDTLHIVYKGNLLDGLLALINNTAFASPQSVQAKSSALTVRLPETLFSKATAENVRYSGSVSADKNSFWKDGTHHFTTDSLFWSPSQTFQNKYQFFIRGFGYPVNNIPFQSLMVQFEPISAQDTLRLQAKLQSELALLSVDGFVDLNKPTETSEWENTEIRISDLSLPFKRVLQNVEQLLSISLPHDSTGISLQVYGTLGDPRVSTE